MNAQANGHLHDDDWVRTVYIDSIGVGTTEFDLSDIKKRKLMREGRRGTETYLDWFDGATKKKAPNK
jgi:NTE family protein